VLALETKSLSKSYGERIAVAGVNLSLQMGTITGFVGPNGAGKTTTLRMLLGLIAPTSGSGSVLGHPLTHPPLYLSEVGALIEAPAFYPKLTGAQNLRVLARLAGYSFSRIDEVIAQVRLQGRENDRYRSYSLGMKQRLGLAAALLPNPQLLILDEPTNGMDPAGIKEMRTLLRGLADQGKTVFVSSHLLTEIQSVCDHLILIKEGEVRFQGPVAQLLAGEGAELRARPEFPADAERLAEALRRQGYTAHVDGDSVVVRANEDYAADLSRLALTLGITLRGLVVVQNSLEDAYFEMTGSEQEVVS
jgi:ABC-2 type transport system ATP-binding protein